MRIMLMCEIVFCYSAFLSLAYGAGCHVGLTAEVRDVDLSEASALSALLHFGYQSGVCLGIESPEPDLLASPAHLKVQVGTVAHAIGAVLRDKPYQFSEHEGVVLIQSKTAAGNGESDTGSKKSSPGPWPHFIAPCKRVMSEVKPQAALVQAVRIDFHGLSALSRGDSSKVGVVQRSSGRVELLGVSDVERLRAELQFEPFCKGRVWFRQAPGQQDRGGQPR